MANERLPIHRMTHSKTFKLELDCKQREHTARNCLFGATNPLPKGTRSRIRIRHDLRRRA